MILGVVDFVLVLVLMLVLMITFVFLAIAPILLLLLPVLVVLVGLVVLMAASFEPSLLGAVLVIVSDIEDEGARGLKRRKGLFRSGRNGGLRLRGQSFLAMAFVLIVVMPMRLALLSQSLHLFRRDHLFDCYCCCRCCCQCHRLPEVPSFTLLLGGDPVGETRETLAGARSEMSLATTFAVLFSFPSALVV